MRVGYVGRIAAGPAVSRRHDLFPLLLLLARGTFNPHMERFIYLLLSFPASLVTRDPYRFGPCFVRVCLLVCVLSLSIFVFLFVFHFDDRACEERGGVSRRNIKQSRCC